MRVGNDFIGPLRASAPGSPVEGQRYYDTVLHKYRVWNGSVWVEVKQQIFRTLHTWTIPDTIAVPSGDTDFIPPFFVSVATGETLNVVKARYLINSGTSATLKIQKNGVDLTGYTSISATTTAASTSSTQAVVEDDRLALVVTAVSGTPKNLAFTLVLEHTLA